MKKVFIKSANVFWLSIALLIVVSALLIQGGRLATPLIERNKDYFANIISQRISSDVRIDQLSAQWLNLTPAISIQGLQIFPTEPSDTQSLPSIAVEQAVIEVDLLASLVRGNWVWKSIAFSEASLRLQQSARGAWQLAGIKTTSSTNNAIDDPTDLFFIADSLSIENVSLSLETYSGRIIDLSISEIEFQNQRDFHRLLANIQFDQKPLARAVLEAHGDPRSIDHRDVTGFVEFSQFPLAELKNFFPQADLAFNDVDPENDSLNAQLWLTSKRRSEYKIVGGLSATVENATINGSQIPSFFETSVGGTINFNPNEFLVSLELRDSIIHWAQHQARIDHFSILLEDNIWNFAFPQIDLSKLSDFSLGFLENQSFLQELLTDLHPTGSLSAVHIEFPIFDTEAFHISANLHSVSVGDWRGAPELKNITGYVSATARSGEVVLNSYDGFSAWFTTAFESPMQFDTARGSIKWQLSPENNQIQIYTGLIYLDGEIGTAVGKVAIDLPWYEGTRSSNMDMFISLVDSDFKYRQIFIPQVINPDLKSWLETSIHQGEITESGFIYRGSLARGGEVNTQLWLGIESGELSFHPQWPNISNIEGRVELNNKQATVNVDSAQLWNTHLHDVVATIERINEQDLINIDGRVQGPGGDGIRLLTETPIKENLGSALDAWQLSSAFEGEISLQIPISDGELEGSQYVDLFLSPGNLMLGDIGLVLEDLTGPLEFSSELGLSSSGLEFSLWNQPASAFIVSEGYSDSFQTQASLGASNTSVHFSSSVDVREVQQWLQSPELLFAQGMALVDGELIIPSASKTSKDKPATVLNIESDLVGVSVNLPEPFNKLEDDFWPFNLQLKINDHQNIYSGKISSISKELNNKNVEFSFLSTDGVIQSAGIGLFDKAPIDYSGLRVTGQLPKFQLDQWLETLNSYEQFQSQVQKSSGKSLDLSFDLIANHADVKIREVNNLHAIGGQLDDALLIAFESDPLKGRIRISEDESAPLFVELEHLKIQSDIADDDSVQTATDPLADVDISEIPYAQVDIQAFYFNDKPYGQWKFDLNPTDNELRVDNILGEINGLEILGINGEGGAQLIWTDFGDMRSSFTGLVSAARIQDTLQNWQQPQFLESSGAKFGLDLAWYGSPAAIELDNLSGAVDLDIEHGRFVRVTEGGSDAFLRLIALFNFDSWARRLKLGVSDLVDSGMAFDSIDGRLQFNNGEMFVPLPVKVKAPSSTLSYAGSFDLVNQQMDTTLVATLPVGGNLTLLAALAGGLPAAAGVYVASKLFKKQVDKVASVSYKITGSWDNPKTEFVRLFDDNAAKKAGKKANEDAQNKSSKALPPKET